MSNRAAPPPQGNRLTSPVAVPAAASGEHGSGQSDELRRGAGLVTGSDTDADGEDGPSEGDSTATGGAGMAGEHPPQALRAPNVVNSVASCAGLDILSSVGLPAAAAVMMGGAGGGPPPPERWGLLPVPGRTEEAVVPPFRAHTPHGGKDEGVEMAPSAHTPEEQEKKLLLSRGQNHPTRCGGDGSQQFSVREILLLPAVARG
ncbi:unnamed protein product [Coccothraustes coccothraustes]